MPPPKMPVWYTDCSELKALEKQQIKKEHSDLPLFSLNISDKTPM